MNNRERQWYEGKYGRHPANCNCANCCESRRLKEQRSQEIADEQARMRVGAEERVEALKGKGEQKPPPRVDWSWLNNGTK